MDAADKKVVAMGVKVGTDVRLNYHALRLESCTQLNQSLKRFSSGIAHKIHPKEICKCTKTSGMRLTLMSEYAVTHPLASVRLCGHTSAASSQR